MPRRSQRGSRRRLCHNETMDSLAGAILLRRYIQNRRDSGLIEPAAPIEPSSLPIIDAWVRAFHEVETQPVPELRLDAMPGTA